MAKNIDFMGATFPDVPSIQLPQHEGGLVSFDDTSDATATAGDIGKDKTAYVNGEKLVGTHEDVTVDPISITSNGTYSAPSGHAYSSVEVNVPNTYTQSDEGKVVSDGGLVEQISDTVTENGIVDTTLINSLEVNVSGGGAEVYLFYHKQLDVPNTTSTTAVDIEEVPLPQGWNDDEHLLYYISRYVGEVPSHHYIGGEITGFHVFFSTETLSFGGIITRKNMSGQIVYSNGATNGVIPQISNGKLYVRYSYYANATYDIGGTYDVKMYLVPKSILQG